MDVWIAGWMDGCMDSWMDQWIDICKQERIKVKVWTHLHVQCTCSGDVIGWIVTGMN